MLKYLNILLLVLVVVACASTPSIPPNPGVSIGNGVAAQEADMHSVVASNSQAYKLSPPVAQAWIGASTASATHALTLTPQIQQSLIDYSNLLTARNKTIDTLNQNIKDIQTEKDSWQHKALGVLMILGVLTVVGGVVTIPYTGTWGRYIILAGIVLSVACACLSLAITALAIILPWFLGAMAVLVVVVCIVSLIKKHGEVDLLQVANSTTTAALADAHAAVKEVNSDIAVHKDPSGSYTPKTEAIVQAAAGIAAAAPIPSPSPFAQGVTSITVNPTK